MKLLILTAILTLPSCSYQSSDKSLNGYMRLDDRADGLGIISMNERKNLKTNSMTILYRITDDTKAALLSEKNRVTLLDGINPWTGELFKKQGVKSFNNKNKTIFDINLSETDKNLLDGFGDFTEPRNDQSIISDHLYNSLPRVIIQSHK